MQHPNALWPLERSKTLRRSQDCASSEIDDSELPQIPKYFEIGDHHRGECKFDENAIFDEKNKVEIEALSQSSQQSVKEEQAEPSIEENKCDMNIVHSNESEEFKSCNSKNQNLVD